MRRLLLRRFEFAVAACFNTAPFGSLIGAPRRARGAGHASHVPLPLQLAAAAAAAGTTIATAEKIVAIEPGRAAGSGAAA